MKLLLPIAIVDWIAGLSLRECMERHFGPAPVSLARRLDKVLHHAGESLRLAAPLTMSALTAATPVIDLRLTIERGKRWQRQTARRLKQLLAGTKATLTLRIEGSQRTEAPKLDYLLRRLARYGDRVSIVLDRRLRDVIRIDPSVFRLVFTKP